MLYFPPALEARHPDAGMPLVIVEGKYKALALWRLAWHGLVEAQAIKRNYIGV
jgi:hypothetical protein